MFVSFIDYAFCVISLNHQAHNTKTKYGHMLKIILNSFCYEFQYALNNHFFFYKICLISLIRDRLKTLERIVCTEYSLCDYILM